MYQKTITDREAGTRFDKYLRKLMPNAGSGFLYKMLRKKNILLNDRKADGSEKLISGDTVSIYFKEETLRKFMKETVAAQDKAKNTVSAAFPYQNEIGVIYENEHILIADKPAGILTQKAAQGDISLNEWLCAYLLSKKEITPDELKTFKPSACNRLDRNTSGIVLCAKSVRGAQMLSEALKSRSLRKYYTLYVKGHMTEEKEIDGYLYKDGKNNKATVYPAINADAVTDNTDNDIKNGKECRYIRTKYTPIRNEKDKTLLEVELITGKSHQIRAHLAATGHPLLGDYKYGDREWNERYRKECGVKNQLLHACKIVFPKLSEPFTDISEKTFLSPLPEIFHKAADT